MTSKVIRGVDSYFTFRLGGEYFAVNVGYVTKILELLPITPVPNSPRFFKGLVNLFGSVLPVFDGRLKFGFPEAKATRNTCILVLVFELDGQVSTTGLIVDSVEKVVVFEADQIKPAPSAGKGFNTEFIEGIVNLNGEFVIILNVEKIFSEDEISIIKEKE